MRIFTTFLLALLTPLMVFAQTANINLTSEKQSIRGFGGMNCPAWGVDLTASQRITAFENGPNQLGFSMLRIYVDGNSSQWSRELPTALAAQARGALIFASPWTPPSTMSELFTKSGDADAIRLKTTSYAAYAQHLIDFITYMKANGIKLYAISIQNEPDWGYDWTWWTATEMLNFMKNNAGAIKAAHPDVKIIAAESFGYSKGMTDPILNDPTALANMDILGTHTYGVTYPSAYPLLKSKTDKEFWMTEVYHPNSDENSADRWPEALEVGLHMHRCLVDAEMQAYVWWYIRRQYGPMREDGNISKRGACMAQFSKFVRPGYTRIDATTTPTTDVYVSAYKKADSVTVVAINKNAVAKTITISVPGATALSWQKYETTATKNVVKGNDIYAKTSFQVTLEPQSMVTFVSVNYPLLKSATPENLSFDLPLETDSFQFTYTTPVNCTLAKATMSSATETFDLELNETGYSDKLTFKIPSAKSLAYGDYTITVSGIKSELNMAAPSNDVVKLTYALPTSGGTIETILEPQASWKAQQTTIGEGIPLGWKRIQGSTNIDVDANGAANITASRMKYFASGGDFDAGFYFSARGEDVCRIIYGEYDGYRVHLKPGDYKISFNSAYWDAGSQTAAIGYNFYVKTLQNVAVYTKTGLTSSSNLNSSTSAFTGSKLNELNFTITEEKDYLLEWTIASGWSAVVLGGIKLETASTLAMKYKDQLAKALEAANILYSNSDTVYYRGSLRTALQTTILSYTSFASTAPSAYDAAIANIKASSDALNTHIANVDTYVSTLNSAKESIAKYNNATNLSALPALSKLIQAVGTYENLSSYENETELATANTSLTTASNQLKSQIDLLKYRINKGISLAKSLKTPVPNSALVDAEAVAIDDDQVANALNLTIKEYVVKNIAENSFVFKADASGTVSNMVDSLDLTNYIKNPNFYTRSTTYQFTNGSFPGWSNPSFTALNDAGMQPLATSTNPIVDSWVSFLNVQVDYFEQTITNVPAGVYDVGFKVRRATGTITQQQLLDNQYIYVKQGATTLKQPLTLVSARELPASPNTWIRNVKVGSDGTFTLGLKFVPVSGYSPTVFFGDPVLFMVGKNNDYIYTKIKEIESNNAVKEVQYYSIVGARITSPVKGLNIVKTIYENGKTELKKIVIK